MKLKIFLSLAVASFCGLSAAEAKEYSCEKLFNITVKDLTLAHLVHGEGYILSCRESIDPKEQEAKIPGKKCEFIHPDHKNKNFCHPSFDTQYHCAVECE